MTFGTVIIICTMADSNVKWHSNKERAVLQLSTVKPIFRDQRGATDWRKGPRGKYIFMLTSACTCMWERNALASSTTQAPKPSCDDVTLPSGHTRQHNALTYTQHTALEQTPVYNREKTKR